MLKEALLYPLKDENRFKTIGIGGLLYIVPALATLVIAYVFAGTAIINISYVIISMFGVLLAGYSLHVFRLAANEETVVPSFSDWKGLFVDGLKVVGVGSAYLIIPTLVFIAPDHLGLYKGGQLSTVGLIVYYSGFILELVAIVLIPVALTNVALTDRLGAAFEFRRIVDAALTDSYLIAVGLWIILGIISSVIISILVVVLVGFFLQYYIQVVLTYILGQGCGSHLIEEQTGEAIAD
jgi:hypothetical protein